MANTSRNFIKGRMNKSLDERLIPNGEYVDALNVRLGSTEDSEIGSVENSKGNEELTQIGFGNQLLSANARCIGAFEEGEQETLYWFVHDPNFAVGATGKLDLIMSYNTSSGVLTYHIISIDDGGGVDTTLNFDEKFLITGVNKVEDLLFFTDNRNAPRFINVTKGYSQPVGNIDQFSAEEILVIKKPPINSPAIVPLSTTSDNNYLEDRFCSFAYRYKYADNEYSATSQFSNPAFIPKPFDFSTESYLNEGMVNATNVVEITYNSGGPLVVGVDLLFKDMNTGTIKVIEKLDKDELGLANDTDYTYSFSNSKIFTVLTDSEILRLYDNVPRLAKAQTLMGNRLMYGNYVEQYDLIDLNNNKVRLEYTTNLVSEEVGLADLPDTTDSGQYTVLGFNNTINDSVFELDFDGVNLVAGGQIAIELRIQHNSFAGAVTPTATTPEVTINFEYFLQQDFASAYDLAQDPNFIRRVGELVQITSGNNTAVNPNELIDTSGGTDFVTDGIVAGDLVTNDSDQQQTSVAADATLATTLTLTDDIFTAFPVPYRIYTSYSIRSVGTACEGSTFTDGVNCAVSSNLDAFVKINSGIDSLPEPIRIISSPASTKIGFQLPAVIFDDGANQCVEYYEVVFGEGSYQETGNPKSLHSNRGYEIGIIYMDEFNRATTALVSENNTEHVPCSNSELTNRIRVTIPVQQLAPAWATRYKFCIKPDKEGYETVYTNLFFQDNVGGAQWFILEGQNSRKVEIGDELIVKTDTSGPINRCVTTTVLDKEAKQADFIDPLPQDSLGNDIRIPAATYMKLRSNNFATEEAELPVVAPGRSSGCRKKSGEHPIRAYDIGSVENPDFDSSQPTGAANPRWIDYTVPAGSRIFLEAEFLRKGSGNLCEKRFGPDLDLSLTASQDYDSFYDWWVGDNIAGVLNSGAAGTDNPSECIPESSFNPTILRTSLGQTKDDVNPDLCVNKWQFLLRDTPGEANYGLLELCVAGTRACGSSKKRRACNEINIVVIRTEQFLVFETQPQDASPDVWYESSVSYPIDQATGHHEGNEQNQTAVQPAIILTEFFNCYAFGNGVESFKIKDSIVGKPLELGNRTTTTVAQDYQEIRRFADITYSGVYNDESNVNKLNEFNLGLLNFKPLEDEYGPVTLLDGRETDILVLQEDKISYVLTGKNLLSDSTGGGAVASVPQVLGTQIARIEEYGNSNNPESFAKWGSNKFFTDAKRGAVIQLKGTSAQNEALSVISEAGMRGWFRDLFILKFDTQKLGGYDPYMNEYVLSDTDIKLPIDIPCIDCDLQRNYTVESGKNITFCVDVGALVGDVIIEYIVTDVGTGTTTIDAEYDGVTVSSGAVGTGVGSITVNKDKVNEQEVEITLSATDVASMKLTVFCPDAQEITIIQVCVNSDNYSGELIHNEYRWTDGSFVSPLHSTQVNLQSGTGLIVSQYDVLTAPQGAGVIPADNADVTLISNKILASGDSFQFDPSMHELRYLRSNTLYNNNTADIQSLLNASIEAVPLSGGPDTFQAPFVMPNTNDQYLYLIYDYRDRTELELCYSDIDEQDVCCNCNEEAAEYLLRRCQDSLVSTPAPEIVATSTIALGPGQFVRVDTDDCVYIVVSSSTDAPTANVTGVATGVTDCSDVCNTYRITNNGVEPIGGQYLSCTNEAVGFSLDGGVSIDVCAKQITLEGEPTATVQFIECDCDDVWLVEECIAEGATGIAINTEFVTLPSGLPGTGFVSLVGDPCTYKVRYPVPTTPTATFSQYENIFDCDEVCDTYRVTNVAGEPKVVEYLDCNQADEQTSDIPEGGSVDICATKITNLPANMTITKVSCGCAL